MSKKGDTLTQKQDRFARFLFQGLTQREAWGRAGYSTKYLPAIIDTNACNLAKLSKVKIRLAEFKAQADAEAILSVVDRKKILSGLAKKTPKYVTPSHVIGAISELNRMERIYEDKPSQTTNQIIFVCRNEETRELLQGLMHGERYVKDSEAKQIEGEVIDKA